MNRGCLYSVGEFWGRSMTRGEYRDPPRFHVVSAWTPTRYPGPSPEETGYRPPSPETSPALPPPVAVTPAPVALPTPAIAPVAPPPARPSLPPSGASGLYDLSHLLQRLWTAPVDRSGVHAAPGPSAPREATMGSPSPTASSPPVVSPNPAPAESTPAILRWGRGDSAPEPTSPRRNRAWICPRCRLTNAPWTRSCPDCRTAAPDL